MALICIMCRDGKGKYDGVVNLRRMYNEEKWDSHTVGQKHKKNVRFWENRVEQDKKEKQRRKMQRGMTTFFSVRKKSSDEEQEEIDGSSDEEDGGTQGGMNEGNDKEK